jgi:aconitase A
MDCSKDVILKVAGILTVKGTGTLLVNILAEGATTLCLYTGKGTICNMGARNWRNDFYFWL